MAHRRSLDEIDRKLLALLQGNARLPASSLARHLGLSRSTVQERIHKLERDKVIAGYTILYGERNSLPMRALVLMVVDPKSEGSVIAALRKRPEVISLHTLSGECDLVAEVVTADTTELDRSLSAIGAIVGIERTTSHLLMTTKLDRRQLSSVKAL